MAVSINLSIIYGIIACLSLALACGYCTLVRKKENWLIWLYFSVFVANLGYFALSISKTLEEALLANRIAYLGCVFLPFFMFMTIMKVCQVDCLKVVTSILAGISFVIFFIAASQGYVGIYYKEVTLVFVNNIAKLQKVYGPLHSLYFIYLFAYMFAMLGVIIYAVKKKKIHSYKHAALLTVVVYFNVCIWFIEQLINWEFEFLSVSYIASEVLLLLLYGMIQDYEVPQEESYVIKKITGTELDFEDLICGWPELLHLSAREKEVFQKIILDKKRKEIADELCITENTVKKHTSNIFAKLNVANRNELFERIRQTEMN